MSIMKRRQCFTPLLAAFMVSLVTVGCGSASSITDVDGTSTQTVRIAVSAAASLQNVLEAIAPQFQATHRDIAVDYNFGSSGTLQQQIEQGAPADVFFSAATKQMDALAQKGLILLDSRHNLVANSLVLIAPATAAIAITDITQLKDADINRFAVGEFRSVPAGQYAEQAFTHMGLLKPLQPKFVFGNNVRSVLAAVASGNAEMGMVYATDAALSDRVKVLAVVPQNSHQPIAYPIALLNSSRHSDAAQTFIEFLTTDTAQKTFVEFGFDPMPPSP